MTGFARLALVISAATGPAAAGESHLLKGIFCTTEAQLDTAVGLLRRGVAPSLAVADINREAVVCVLATHVAYMIVQPRPLGDGPRYAGTLVGVLVGDNPRPVDPPVEMFFLPDAPLSFANQGA